MIFKEYENYEKGINHLSVIRIVTAGDYWLMLYLNPKAGEL